MIKDVKMMAKKILYVTLAGVLMLFSSCNEDLVGDYVQPTEKHFGEEILFGGSASYNVNGGTKNGTRTVYGGYENIADGKEPVYWVAGDNVRIYCPQGAVKTADYLVTTENTSKDGKVVQTGLSKRGDAGLQWGNTDSEHIFYAVYPQPEVDNYSLKESSEVIAQIPNLQISKARIANSGSYVFEPNMNYAYMVAKTSVLSPNEMKKDESVYMRFVPIATAVEISIKNDTKGALNIQGVTLRSQNNFISGDFRANIDEMTVPTPEEGSIVSYGIKEGFPIYRKEDGVASRQISIPLYDNISSGHATKLEDGKSVTFTAFILPTADINDLEIVIQSEEATRSGKLNGITIQKTKKNYLHNISLPNEPGKYDQSNWVKFLEDEVYIKGLSIPGAGGAGSEGVQETTAKAQTKTIEALWKSGIRCFEFSVDIASNTTDGNGVIKYGDISLNNVLCHGVDCGKTLNDAVNAVKVQLETYPDEFAMVILTYQTTGGYKNRDCVSFMHQINNFWKKVKGTTGDNPWEWKDGCGTLLYDPANQTVADVRGKLLCIVRPTSENQDYLTKLKNIGSATNFKGGQAIETEYVGYESLGMPEPYDDILVIKGWGPLKDKWNRRGYTADSKRATNINGSDSKPGRPFDTAEGGLLNDASINTSNYTITLSNLTPDFAYDVYDKSNETQKGAWVQEWARVSNWNSSYNYENASWGKDRHVYWANSYNEKLTRVKECLQYSISKSITNYPKVYVYINSLCGYFIDKNIESSYTPCVLTDWNADKNQTLSLNSDIAGLRGDIETYAEKINKDFYDYLKGVVDGEAYKPGPMGVILMDRVGDGDGAAIASMVINNNFRHELEKEEDITIPLVRSANASRLKPQNQTHDDEKRIILWE